MFSKLFSSALLVASALQGMVAANPVSLVPRAVGPVGGQVSVDGAGVYMRATRLHDGSILGGYAAQEGTDKVLRVARSTDEGASWRRVGEVARQPAANHDLDNAFPIQLPSGRILMAFRNHDTAGPRSDWYFRITVTFSEDNGVSWRFIAQADERHASGDGRNGLWEPFMRIARDGSVQLYYSSENNSGDQDNVVKISPNGGQAWEGPYGVSGQGLRSRDGMTAVADIDGNGNLICVFENTEIGRFSINAVFSQDDGRTWNSRARVYTSAREAGAPYVVNVGGTLVTSFMTNENTNTPRIDGGEMKVVTSGDRGRSWSAPTVTGGAGSHWPAMLTLNGNEFLALYSQNGRGLVSQKYHK